MTELLAAASLDHITPVSKGGTDTVDNLAIVLSSVNSAKGTMTLEEFVAMCRMVATHHDNKCIA